MAGEQLNSHDLGCPGQFLLLYRSDCQAQKLRIPEPKGKPGAHLHPETVDSPHL